MKKIDEKIALLKPSRPIFKLEASSSSYDNTTRVDMKRLSEPVKVADSTALGDLVDRNYEETWSEGRYKIQPEKIRRSCMEDIQRFVLAFLRDTMAQKHPTETKQYLFYQARNYREEGIDEFNNSLIGIYEYMQNNKIYEEGSSKHVQNALSLLEFLFIKFKESFPEPEKPTRRRRRRRR